MSRPFRSSLFWFLICLLLFGFYSRTQDRIVYQDGHAYDGGAYWHQANLVANDRPVKNWKPFVYRLGAPFVVGKAYPPTAEWLHANAPAVVQTVPKAIPAAGDLDPKNMLDGYTLLGWLCSILVIGLLFLLLRLYGIHAPVAWGLVALFIANPLSPIRFSPYFPAFSDPLAMVFFLGLFALYKARPTLGPVSTISLCALAFAGSLVREMVVLIPLTFLGAHFLLCMRKEPGRQFLSLQTLARLLPIGAVGLGLYFTRQWVEPLMVGIPEKEYSTLGHAQKIWQRNVLQPEILFLCFFYVLGPFVVWLAASLRKRPTLRFLRQHVELWFYVPGMTVLALIAGNHTDRFIFWVLPGLLPWLGMLWQDRIAWPRMAWSRWVFFGTLLIAQVLAYRALWPIPNDDFMSLNVPGTPDHLWLAAYGENTTFGQVVVAFMERWARMQLVLQYLALGAFLVLVLAVDGWLTARKATTEASTGGT